jgi:hypothetical protein
MGNRFGATLRRWAPALLVAGMGLVGHASAALIDRGGGLIYDNVLNITWLQDANYAQTSGFDADGRMTWPNANAWAAGLSYFDSVRNVTWTDWRLPSMDVNGDTIVVDCTTNVDCPDNEYGHMFYQNLNGTFGLPKTGNQVGDGGVTLNNIQDNGVVGPTFYWSGTASANLGQAWAFAFDVGERDDIQTSALFFAWAARPGDVGITAPPGPPGGVPEPGSLVLLGLGFGALALSRRRKKT